MRASIGWGVLRSPILQSRADYRGRTLFRYSHPVYPTREAAVRACFAASYEEALRLYERYWFRVVELFMDIPDD